MVQLIVGESDEEPLCKGNR